MFKIVSSDLDLENCDKPSTPSVQKPVYVSRSSEGYLTTGCWSPTRPAVLYIGLIDGTIEVWDLLDHSHQPSMTATVSSCQLTSMEFWKLQSMFCPSTLLVALYSLALFNVHSFFKVFLLDQ